MERNIVELINKEKQKLEILKERYNAMLVDVKGLGAYFVENITVRNLDLYNDILEAKRVYENVENIICINSHEECYYERLTYLNERFNVKLTAVEEGINRIVISKKHKFQGIEK